MAAVMGATVLPAPAEASAVGDGGSRLCRRASRNRAREALDSAHRAEVLVVLSSRSPSAGVSEVWG